MPAVLYSEHQLDSETARRVSELDASVVGKTGRAFGDVTAQVSTFLQRVKHALPGEKPEQPPALPVPEA